MHISYSISENHQKTDDLVSLDYQRRFLRRKKLTTDKGEDFMVELPEARSVSPQQAFVLDDGRFIGILAQVESLLKVTHPRLTEIAWHIGNRHTPCQIAEDCLYIQQDHVLEDLLNKLGATVEQCEAPFTPLGGAYGHGRTHAHRHD